MKPDYAMISSYNCPFCSRSPGAGHHDDCPRHPLALAKLVEKERALAAAQYASAALDVQMLAIDDLPAALRATFCAGAQWAASKARTE